MRRHGTRAGGVVLFLTVGLTPLGGAGAWSAEPALSPTAGLAADATPAPSDRTAEPLFEFLAQSLPRGETYVSIQRVRYLPGVELAEPTIDGPRLLRVTAGALTVRAELPGAVASRGTRPGSQTDGLAPRVDHAVEPGTTVAIPAGIPVVLKNRGAMDAEWVQVQLETPATLCPCGADLTGVRRELLASETLPDALDAPAVLALTSVRLDPGQDVPGFSGAVRLVGTVDQVADLEHDVDGSTTNAGEEPVSLLVLTIVESAETRIGAWSP